GRARRARRHAGGRGGARPGRPRGAAAARPRAADPGRAPVRRFRAPRDPGAAAHGAGPRPGPGRDGGGAAPPGPGARRAARGVTPPRGPWAVVPAFNEAATLGDLVRGVRSRCGVIVVDDGSTDGSGAVAVAAGADVIRHARRRGKGAALRTGFAAALRRGAPAVVTLDGDAQHDPADLPRLLRASAAAPDALIVGDRLAGSAG